MMLASPSMSGVNDDSNNHPSSNISYLSSPPPLPKHPIRNSVSASIAMSVPVHANK
jgi:hypothetical protein